METDGDVGGGGEAERRESSDLGRLLEAIGSSEVPEKRIPLVKQLQEEFSADDLGLILQGLLASWIDSTCSGVSHCSLHKSILQAALKYSDLDITDRLGQFLTLGAKASSWCEKHIQLSAKCIQQSLVGEEEEHNRLRQEVNSLSLSISTKLLYIAAKRITIPGLEVAEGEQGQAAAQDDECVLNKAGDVFPTLDTMAVEVEPATAHLAVAMRRGAMAPQWCRCTHCASENTPRWYQEPDGRGTLCSMCWHRFKNGRLQHSNPGRPCRGSSSKHPPCLNCGSEKTPRCLRGPDGPSTLCSACGQRFLIGRLSNPRRRRGQQLLKGRLLDSNSHRHRDRPSKERRSSSKEDLAAGNDVAALAEALPCGVGASLDAFFDHTCSEMPWGDANEEEELEWLSNKDAFPSVETMAMEVEEEASAPGVPRARTKGRRRVTAMEKETVRRCIHCATENTPQWREGGTLCNACGTVFKMKGRLLPEYRPANSPAFSPLLHSNRYKRVLEMHRRSESSATGEMHVVLMDPPANGPTSSPPAEKGTVRRCTRCATEKSPRWRKGPEGPRTLCNACGVVFKMKGRLLPEYCPANSPSYSPLLHSNRYNHVLEMHRRNETSATGEMQVAAAEVPRGEESMEVQLLTERPPVDTPAFSLVSPSLVLKRRRKSEAATFAAIRATAKAGRADRAAARLAAMDN